MSTDLEQKNVSISEAIQQYLRMVERARSRKTMLAYKNALNVFCQMLNEKSTNPNTTPITQLNEEQFSKFIDYLSPYTTATEQLYLQAVKGFYLFLDSEKLTEVNQSRLTVFMRQRARRPGKHAPPYKIDEIDKILKGAQNVQNLVNLGAEEGEKNAKLRAYRDRAFLFMLAETGLRVHEACNLRRGDIDWNEGRAIITGKGNKQAVIRFTTYALQVVKEYLAQRAELDGASGKQLSSLPLFARHDKGAGKKIKPITTTTGRNIVNECVERFLGQDLVGEITPHTFRHYFVTTTLRATGNLAIAQRLARHENIQVTNRYTQLADEELDKAYYDIFEKDSKWKNDD
ncbi:MAG TPA: tyrosine-type recombinase/integrase [Anaerolineales bacterium]|nr:tyrosine-type recombinase/integrase [Anaerolineales bacterium]